LTRGGDALISSRVAVILEPRASGMATTMAGERETAPRQDEHAARR
jgi:hypothetical protein